MRKEPYSNKRVAYYVYWASDWEHGEGEYHQSLPYESKGDAKFGATLKKKRYQHVYILEFNEVNSLGKWLKQGEGKKIK